MRLVLFFFVVFLAGSCVFSRYFDEERDETLKEPAVLRGTETEDDVETEQQELQDTENVDDKPSFEKAAQHVRIEKRGFRSYFYNYLDEMAMSICAGVPSRSGGYILAIRRTCSGSLTCKKLCTASFLFTHNKQDWIKSKKWTCLESLHVYKSRPVLSDNFVGYTDSYKLGLQVYRYHTCGQSGCGPNYCCCQYN